jgi:hypothetical protein
MLYLARYVRVISPEQTISLAIKPKNVGAAEMQFLFLYFATVPVAQLINRNTGEVRMCPTKTARPAYQM